MLELNPFIEENWTPAETRRWIAFGVSVGVHVAIILLLLFGIPIPSRSPVTPAPTDVVGQPIAMTMPALKQRRPAPKPAKAQPPVPPPPAPPMQEVELGPNSKKPDAPAKEAAAQQSDADMAGTPAPKTPAPTPPQPAETKPPTDQPAAPQRILMPRAGDFSANGKTLPMPTTSPWSPPALDSASGEPADNTVASDAAPMGRSGLANRDPEHWKNSFDDETSGRCVTVPDFGKNPDGSPVLAAVLGRVLDTDGRTPLGGAHLQIEGTEFGTFSDANGNYRLSFDPKLLAQCRKQYVDVVAPGYRSQQLTLMIGPRVRSPDVVLHH